MSLDLTGISNINEYYTNHYFSTIFEDNAEETISTWRAQASESEEVRVPWSILRQNARRFYVAHDRFVRTSYNLQMLNEISSLTDDYLSSLGYPAANPELIQLDETTSVPVYLEINKNNGTPLMWVILSASAEEDAGIMESHIFDAALIDEDATGGIYKGLLSELSNEEIINKIFFAAAEPPRFLLIVGLNQIALIDRNKWNEKRYLQFDLEDIFSRLEDSTLKVMAVLLHRNSLCPDDGKVLLDEFDEQSQKNASGVSQDLKYALRESIERLGNEVLYDLEINKHRDFQADPVDAGQLTLECLRYMYRMLFMLFIEARPELGYAPVKAQSYYSAYSLESLREIAENVRADIEEVGDGYYLHETLAKLYDIIYNGYPKSEEELEQLNDSDSLHDLFLIAPLKAHIFDPEYTRLITSAKLRNSCMLKIIDLMSVTRPSGKRNSRRGRISYANLGINQLGAVYEALLSYRGFIAENDLYEVKRAGDTINELEVGYFVPENELDQYTEDERVYIINDDGHKKLKVYPKGSFIYRLAGREREKSASYYTPEVLTKCLVKYALKELLEGKTADEILSLTVCEPAMGSAAFLNEAINQLAEAYISRKEQETGEIISYDKRFDELQKVKMFIADRNVYGIDLNPVAVELAEVSLWLNTIHEGGFVPWFGTQLINGNSLIGARRQCYRTEQLTTNSKGLRWYENAPERVTLGTQRADKNYQQHRKQIYHFLLGDPGMCSYSDKVIKSLEPDNIKLMNIWNKSFNKPYSDDEVETLLKLSETIDKLWEAQVKLRQEVEIRTQDNLNVFGHKEDFEDSHTSIRQKDKILSELYKSEHMKNAGPYARLKFAMDYWCSLWFWPIDKAELLPTRSEFLFDMSVILEGTLEAMAIDTSGQMSWDTSSINIGISKTEDERLVKEFIDIYGMDTVVDIQRLRNENPRLQLAWEIAEQNKFMHWELEFADLFAERGGFDLVIGNPPWILLSWNEQNVIGDYQPSFLVKNLSAAQTANLRSTALANEQIVKGYRDEYTSISGQQSFITGMQNYPYLQGLKNNLFKCFIVRAWEINSPDGFSAFIHPEGVYDDPKGGALREKIYPRLRKHFMFANERKLFPEVDHHTTFSINVYGGPLQTVSFDTICNLYDAKSIVECYEGDSSLPVPGIKDENGWCTTGHPDRIIHITPTELKLFNKLFDVNDNWKTARLPVIHCRQIVDALSHFASAQATFDNYKEIVYSTIMWVEAPSIENGIIKRNEHFPEKNIDMIYSGPHVGVANPLYKSSRRNCILNSDYDVIRLENVEKHYLQRCTYQPAINPTMYVDQISNTQWDEKYNHCYKIAARKMLNQSGERTLMSAIIPRNTAHIDGIFGIAINDSKLLVLVEGLFASLPFDFYIKATGMSNFRQTTLMTMPIIKYNEDIIERIILLNMLTDDYSELYSSVYSSSFILGSWTKSDERLNNNQFQLLLEHWTPDIPLRNDYSRRQALIEIDVLVAMGLGMSLNQLCTIYRIQFPVLQQYEADTWYDANGQIVFTNNRGLTGIGFSRTEWENSIKGAPAGQKFYRTIIDDTMPGGPVERTIEYVAPFDRCDREQDYETAWKFFEDKYGKESR